MTAESLVHKALAGIAGGHVYADIAPPNSKPPWVTYIAAGGKAINTLGNDNNNVRNTRMQIDVWASTRAEAAAIMEAVFAALNNEEVRGVPIGAPVSTYEMDTRLYGSRMDFSINWRQ